MKLGEDDIKIVAVDVIYNFVVEKFFISNFLVT